MKLLSISFLLVLFQINVWSQDKIQLSPVDQKLMDSLSRAHLTESGIPGFAIGFASNGKILYASGWGVKKLGKNDPITTRSVFHMASISKTFVSTAVGQLVEQGKIDLEAPVTTYLPYFELKDERHKDITVKHLLTHTSGIPDVMNYHWKNPKHDDKALEDHVRSLKKKGLNFEPGSKYRYSNNGFEVLGDIISKASGMTFEEYVKQNILKPTGMDDSSFIKREIDTQLATTGHVGRGTVKVSKVYPYNREHAPSSTLNSNVEDMLKYAIMYMNRGKIDGTQVISEEVYELVTREHFKISDTRSIGLSWFIGNASWRDDGMKRISHSGGDTGYRSWLGIIPDKQWAMIILYNGEQMPNSDALFDAAFEMAQKYD